MPWMVPRLTLRSISRLAQTGPKRLLIPLSSMAKSETAPPEGRCSICDESGWLTCARSRALAVGHGKANALLGDTKRDHAGLEACVTALEGVVDGDVNALEHRGQHRARRD